MWCRLAHLIRLRLPELREAERRATRRYLTRSRGLPRLYNRPPYTVRSSSDPSLAYDSSLPDGPDFQTRPRHPSPAPIPATLPEPAPAPARPFPPLARSSWSASKTCSSLDSGWT